MAKLFSRKVIFALWLTFVGLWAERIMRAAWPLLSTLAFGIGVTLLAAPDLWPLSLLKLAGGIWLLSGLCGLWYFFKQFSAPSLGAALARLDQSLPDRPLAALRDRQALSQDDPATAALWQAHLAQMRAVAAKAPAVGPQLDLAPRDPFALRYIAVLVFVIGGIFGSVQAVRTGLGPSSVPIAAGPPWEAWLQPPAYTRRPVIYLNDVIGAELSVPQDTMVLARLYGDAGLRTVEETLSGRSAGTFDAADPSQQFLVTRSGRLAISGPDGAAWQLSMVPDTPPEVEVTGEVERAAEGSFSLRFTARDDVAVTAGRAVVQLNRAEVDRRYGLAAEPEPQPDIELTLPMTISGDRAEFTEVLTEDLSKHVWAHLPVLLRLEVEDMRGQLGQSAALEMALPARNFFDPLAKALVEQRRDLLWAHDNQRRVAQILRAISQEPEALFRDMEDAEILAHIIRDMDAGMDPKDAAELLWILALEVEDGDLAQAAQKLARAQDKLAEAIRNGATPEEIARMMDELRQAQKEYFKEFAERNPPSEQPERLPNDEAISESQLQEMMERLQQLMEEGRMAEAQELLEEINRMMQNLQMTPGQPGSDGQEGQDGQEGGGQQMEDLAIVCASSKSCRTEPSVICKAKHRAINLVAVGQRAAPTLAKRGRLHRAVCPSNKNDWSVKWSGKGAIYPAQAPKRGKQRAGRWMRPLKPWIKPPTICAREIFLAHWTINPRPLTRCVTPCGVWAKRWMSRPHPDRVPPPTIAAQRGNRKAHRRATRWVAMLGAMDNWAQANRWCRKRNCVCARKN